MRSFFTLALGLFTLTGFGQSQMNIFRHSGQLLQIPLSDIDSITYSTIVSGPVLASVTTAIANNISQTGCISGGNVTADGGSNVTERGVCYSTTPNPTTSNIKMINGMGTGSFADTLSGLVSGTTYYLRAYATNTTGTAYGNQITFTTQPNGPVNVIEITDSVLESIEYNSTSYLFPTKLLFSHLKRVNGTGSFASTNNIVEIDLPELVSMANFLSLNSNISLQKFLAPKLSSLGDFLVVIKNTSLQQLDVCNLADIYCDQGEPSIEIYDNNSTIDSNLACIHPTLHVTQITTTPITQFSSNTAIGGGTYTHFCHLSSSGVCWSTHPNPTLNDFSAPGNGNSVSFVANMTGLSPNTTYFVRAYYNNTYYNEVSFTTLP